LQNYVHKTQLSKIKKRRLTKQAIKWKFEQM
jgi:hypothetical protein